MYSRPPNKDFLDAREFEEVVESHLPTTVISHLDSQVDLDFCVQGYFFDVKEKKQRLGERWTKLWPGAPERDLFILDELSVRKALEPRYNGWTYFLIHDVPESRYFVMSIWEIVCGDHVRVNRCTSHGNRKGKWIINLSQYRQIGSLDDLDEFIRQDLRRLSWKTSQCLIPTGDV